jgi:hypothetical protein
VGNGGVLPKGKANRAFIQNILICNMLSKNIKFKIDRTIVLPVLCGCEIWCLIFREQYMLKVFSNMVLGMIFGPKKE